MVHRVQTLTANSRNGIWPTFIGRETPAKAQFCMSPRFFLASKFSVSIGLLVSKVKVYG